MMDYVKRLIQEAKDRKTKIACIYVDPETYKNLTKTLLKDKLFMLQHFDGKVTDMKIMDIPVYCDREKEGGVFIQIDNDIL